MPPLAPFVPAIIGAAGVVGAAAISSSANKKAAEANSSAINDSNAIMAQGQAEAARLISEGQVAAAQAIIEGAKIAAQATMQAAELSVEAQERFFAIADKKLEPFRQQGLIAQDELASMLGIPNADGQLVPYDINKLRETPGYQFFFEEGNRSVDRSAVGTKLSGAQAKALTNYGQGYAERYFENRVDDLANMQGKGLQAAGALADAAGRTGAGIGGAYTNAGQQLASIYNNQGTNLANIATGGANAQADLATSLANVTGNNALAAGANRASLYTNQAGVWGGAIEGMADIYGTYSKNRVAPASVSTAPPRDNANLYWEE